MRSDHVLNRELHTMFGFFVSISESKGKHNCCKQ